MDKETFIFMEWQKKILKEKHNEIVKTSIFFVLLALSVLLWHYFTGKSFEWTTIEPISQPDLFSRLFYSALVYVTLGALLYSLGFYKFLYSLYRGTQNGWREYNETKRMVWVILVLGMYFVIVPFVVYLLNTIISFGYNVLNLLLYLIPPLGIAAILFTGYSLIKRWKL